MFLFALLLRCALAIPSWCAVIVDSRFEVGVVASISNARKHIPLHVPIYLVTGAAHRAAAEKALQMFTNVFLSSREHNRSTIGDYNALMLSVAFWSDFTEDYILVFQRDSRFCSLSPHRIEEFVGRFDYIGALWTVPRRGVFIGNGGFSLRSRRAMIFCAQTRQLYDVHNEDEVFGICVNRSGLRTATRAQAADFSIESVRSANSTPMAIHKSWLYIPNDYALARFCPESVRV